jgi:hypothetical protein
MGSFGVAAAAATVVVYQVLHMVMLAPPKFGTHGSSGGSLFVITITLGTIARVGERKKNSKVHAEGDGLSMI